MSHHCRYCGKRGHNRRSCPTMKESAANGSTWAKQEVERYKNIASRPKTCTYCRQGGHNRASCQKLIGDYVSTITENAKYRKEILEKMKLAGLGIGALVSPRYAEKAPEIISDIRWDRVCYLREHEDIICVDGEDYASYPLQPKRFSINLDSDEPKYLSSYFMLENGVNTNDIENQIPTDWISGKCAAIDDSYGMNEKKRRRM